MTHIIYGLFQKGHPRNVLYVGSWKENTLPDRIEQHRNGYCKTTAKMAKRDNVKTNDLRAHALRLWEEESPEYHILKLCKVFGMARWNFPYAFTSEDNRRGGITNAKSGHLRRIAASGGRANSSENKRRAGRIGGSRGTQENRSKAGLIGGPIGMHVRWHVNRGIVNPDCPFCMESKDA